MPKKIEAKIMKENLKKGWTTEEFCTYLGMSAIDFNEALENSFQDRALRDMKSQLTKNEKIRKKHTQPSINPLTLPSLADITPIVSTNITKDKKKVVKSVDELRKDADSLRDEIASIETSRKDLMQKRRDFYLSLASEKEYLTKILKEVNKKEEIINGLISKLKALEDEITKINTSISSKESELETLNKEINKLNKIIIFFYNDGSFEFDGKKNETTVDVEEINKIVSNALANPVFEELTIKQIRGIARLKVILSTIDSKFEITFENSVLEKAFNSI